MIHPTFPPPIPSPKTSWATKKNSYFPLYWLFTRNPYDGLLSSPHFHEPLKPMKNKGFGHLKTRLFTIKTSKNVRFWGFMVGTRSIIPSNYTPKQPGILLFTCSADPIPPDFFRTRTSLSRGLWMAPICDLRCRIDFLKAAWLDPRNGPGLMVQKSHSQPPFGWCPKPQKNNGITYHPWDSAGFVDPSTVGGGCSPTHLKNICASQIGWFPKGSGWK